MPQILQASLQKYVNRELSDVQGGFRKGRGTRDQTANIHWIIKKAREFQENIYFCFIDYAKAFACVDHKKLQKILKEMGIPDHLTCLLRNLYAGQKATFRTGHVTDWFQIGKGVHQGCILPPYLFNLRAEYIMRNAGLEEIQAEIEFARKKKSVTISPVAPSIFHEAMGLDAMILVFWMLSFKPTFSLSFFTLSSRGSLDLLHFLP